jgi:hypothetical protein
MKYKLLVLDVDGTLLNSDKQISPRALSAILKVQQMGIQVVLSSGRPMFGILPIAKKLELDHYNGFVMAYNGAQIMNAQTGHIIFEKRLDKEIIPYLDRKAKQNQFVSFTYDDDTIITDSPFDPHVFKEAEINNMTVTESPLNEIEFNPFECVIAADDSEALIAMEQHWTKRLAGVADVFRSEEFFLEVLPPSVNKGNSLALLMEKIGVKRDEVAAIGDGIADVPMLQLAGTSIAMGNALDSVKVCCDHTTLSNDEEGVAIAIETGILAEIRPADVPLDKLNERGKHALMGNLGIQYTYASEGRVEATMPVDERTRQPFGILHGGATLALAETVAGLGSMILAKPDEIVVGMQVSGNHMSSAHEGDTVRAVGTIIHRGRSSHVWNVDIFTSTDKLVSSVRVVNSIIQKK